MLGMSETYEAIFMVFGIFKVPNFRIKVLCPLNGSTFSSVKSFLQYKVHGILDTLGLNLSEEHLSDNFNVYLFI